jgi:hypothetical protein
MPRTLAAALVFGLCCTVLPEAKQPLSFFKPVETPLATTDPIAGTAAADLNGDGLLDVVASTFTGTLQVLLGGRRGAFSGPANYALPGPGTTANVAIADFNNDGHPDVAVGASGIAVLLGVGDGSLQSPIVSAGSGQYLLADDVDADGVMDLVSMGHNFSAPQPETVDVYRGLGDGTFEPFRNLFVSDEGLAAIAVGDLDGNGLLDLVVHLNFLRVPVVLLNQGGLAFSLSFVPDIVQIGPLFSQTADVDGNGTMDLVTANTTGNVSVNLGSGDGTLQAEQVFSLNAGGCTYPACPRPTGLALADLNQDGLMDVAVSTTNPGGVSVLLNAGQGVLALTDTLQAKDLTTGVLAGDFDADGAVDLALVTSGAGAEAEQILSVFLSKLHTNPVH